MSIPSHQAPECEVVFGDHDQCPRDYRRRDDALTAATAGSVLGMIIRAVGGFSPSDQTWSRTRCSYQWNRHMELGWAHASSTNSWQLLGTIATELPAVATFAYGDLAKSFPNKDWQNRMYREVKGRVDHSSQYDPYIAGWAQICGRADVQALYTREWFKEFVAPAISAMKARGARSCRLLALGGRMLGSKKTNISILKDAIDRYGDTDEAFEAAGREYGKKSRVDRIRELVPSGCKVSSWPTPNDIRWPSTTPSLAADTRFNRPGDQSSGANRWAMPIIILALGLGGFFLWRRSQR